MSPSTIDCISQPIAHAPIRSLRLSKTIRLSYIPIDVHLLKKFSTVKCTTNKANIYCFINVVLVVVKINHQNHKRRPLMKAFFLAFFALSCGVSLNSDFYTKWIDSKLFMAFNRRGALS